jgi:hypothetical protein
MEIEYLIIFLLIIIVVIHAFKDEAKEYFLDLGSLPQSDVPLTDEQVDDMSKVIDNSDVVDQFIYGNIGEETGWDFVNGKFPQKNGGGPPGNKSAHSLYNFSVNPNFVDWNDKLSSDGLRRSTHNKTAILGNIRNRTAFSKRILEEELQENERRDWWEDTLQDVTVDDPRYFVPDWALPKRSNGSRRDSKYR